MEAEDIGFTPFSNYVVIELIEKKSSIMLTEKASRKILKNLVVRISKDTDKDGNPLVRNVKVGDNVVLSPMVANTGIGIMIKKKEYLLVRENEILGTLNFEPEDEEVPKLTLVN